MNHNETATPTLTEAESQVMRTILTPLRPLMREATPDQTWTEDEIFSNIACPLLTHLRTSLTEIVSTASLWREIRQMIRLECVTDGQWRQMGDYAVLMVRFGIRDASVTGMQLARSMRMAHWGPLHIVTTLQSRPITRTDEALERSSGMTLSRADLVL